MGLIQPKGLVPSRSLAEPRGLNTLALWVKACLGPAESCCVHQLPRILPKDGWKSHKNIKDVCLELNDGTRAEAQEEGGRSTCTLTLGCQFSYCFWRLAPMVSRAFCGLMDRGSVEGITQIT